MTLRRSTNDPGSPRQARTSSRLALLPLLALASFAGGCGSEDAADDSTPWQDHTYLLNVPPVNWSEPRGVGDEIGDFVPDFVISVGRSADGTHEIDMGTAESGAQEMCNPTTEIDATGSYPSIDIGPLDFPVFIRHIDEDIAVQATIYDLTITNVMPENSPPESGELRAVMDFREVYSMFTQLITPTPDTVCTALQDALMATCEPCRDGEPYCLALAAVELGANEADLSLAPVENADPACIRP